MTFWLKRYPNHQISTLRPFPLANVLLEHVQVRYLVLNGIMGLKKDLRVRGRE